VTVPASVSSFAVERALLAAIEVSAAADVGSLDCQ
jgi:hypothetical protein